MKVSALDKGRRAIGKADALNFERLWNEEEKRGDVAQGVGDEKKKSLS
jgi:hypothetical protein